MDRVRIMDEKWDHLIILDACRFDYFEKVWTTYLSGQLHKRISIGSNTVEWRDKSFPGKYADVVYVSSNPYINSIAAIGGFQGSHHFHQVCDVWKTGWDEKKGTVLPETVTNAALRALKEHRGKRTIVHYLQPHAPYLTLDIEGGGFPIPDLEGARVLTGLKAGIESGAKRLVLRSLTWMAYKAHLLGYNPVFKVREILRMEPAGPIDAARRIYGDEGLRKAYRANLETVLNEVSRLVRYMSGRIIVTSDHGELLGEGGRYSHRGGSSDPRLMTIPWLVINRPGSEAENLAEIGRSAESGDGTAGTEKEDTRIIRERLKGLGYTD